MTGLASIVMVGAAWVAFTVADLRCTAGHLGTHLKGLAQ